MVTEGATAHHLLRRRSSALCEALKGDMKGFSAIPSIVPRSDFGVPLGRAPSSCDEHYSILIWLADCRMISGLPW